MVIGDKRNSEQPQIMLVLILCDIVNKAFYSKSRLRQSRIRIGRIR